MSRHRWYRADWPFSLETLAKKLRASPFSRESREGFIVDRWRKDVIEGRYVQQVDTEEETVDPFGARSTSTRTTYSQTSFVVTDDALVELIDPARGTQRFVSRLLEITDFSLVIAPRKVSVRNWADQLSKLIEGPHFVSLLQVSSLRVAPGVKGKFSFAGVGDVRPVAAQFVKELDTVDDKIQITVQGRQPGQILLAANASANISATSDNLLEAARTSIRLLE